MFIVEKRCTVKDSFKYASGYRFEILKTLYDEAARGVRIYTDLDPLLRTLVEREGRRAEYFQNVLREMHNSGLIRLRSDWTALITEPGRYEYIRLRSRTVPQRDPLPMRNVGQRIQLLASVIAIIWGVWQMAIWAKFIVL